MPTRPVLSRATASSLGKARSSKLKTAQLDLKQERARTRCCPTSVRRVELARVEARIVDVTIIGAELTAEFAALKQRLRGIAAKVAPQRNANGSDTHWLRLHFERDRHRLRRSFERERNRAARSNGDERMNSEPDYSVGLANLRKALKPPARKCSAAHIPKNTTQRSNEVHLATTSASHRHGRAVEAMIHRPTYSRGAP